MSAARAEHGTAGVVEVDILKFMSVVGSTSSCTIIGKGHAQPVSTECSGEVDGFCLGTFRSELGTCAIKGESLAWGDLHFDTWHDGQIRAYREVGVGWVDANWAVTDVPNWVCRDISRHIGSLAFVWHDAIVDCAIHRGGLVTIVVVVVGPEWRNETRASNCVARERQLRLLVGPNRALDVVDTIATEVKGSFAVDLNAVVRVVAAVGGSEVFEVKSCWDVDVDVAVCFVLVPPIA